MSPIPAEPRLNERRLVPAVKVGVALLLIALVGLWALVGMMY